MREAIEQYIEREEARERLRHDALAAWADYQATGLQISAEEADRCSSALRRVKMLSRRRTNSRGEAGLDTSRCAIFSA
jgi:hypothetical protein